MKGIGSRQRQILSIIDDCENNSVKYVYFSCKQLLYPLSGRSTKEQLSCRRVKIFKSVNGLLHKKCLIRINDKLYITPKVHKYIPENFLSVSP